MVSERSRLFEAHPDWAVGVPGRPRTESRQQLVLDMSRPEVVDHLFGVLSEVLASAPISYIKWDMNRTITEPFSAALPAERQGEFFHRYILGVYDLYARLTAAFPEILFESCAGGGGRFDPGMLAYAPQAWTSDDTDAVERLADPVGDLAGLPAELDGRPRRGRPEPPDRPDHADRDAGRRRVLRRLRLRARPDALTATTERAIADQIAFYKAHRELFQRGRFVRLRSPFEGDGNQTAWMVVAPDRSRAIVGYYQDAQPARARRPTGCGCAGSIRRASIASAAGPTRDDPLVRANAGPRGGDELMRVGLSLGADRHDAGDLGRLPGLAVRPRGGLTAAARSRVAAPGCDAGLSRRCTASRPAHPVRMRLARRRCPASTCMRLGEWP